MGILFFGLAGTMSLDAFINSRLSSTLSESNPLMLYQCVDSGFHLTVNTVVRSGEVVWFDFASSTVDFTLNSGPVVEWINSFSQVSLKNPGLKTACVWGNQE